MIQVDGNKDNVLIDGDVLTIMAELSLITHDHSMIEHIPDDILIGAFIIGLSDKHSGSSERYKRIIEDVRRKVVDLIEDDIKETFD